MHKCFINWDEVKNFPGSLLTKCPVQSWYVAGGTGLVLASLVFWIGLWIIPFLVAVYLVLEHDVAKYSWSMFLGALIGATYWELVRKPHDWKVWLLVAVVVAMSVSLWFYFSTHDSDFYKKDFYMYDKLMHFAGWGALAIYAYPIFHIWFSHPLSLFLAATFSFVFGILYEVKDCYLADGFSIIDLLADVAGIVVASILLLVK